MGWVLETKTVMAPNWAAVWRILVVCLFLAAISAACMLLPVEQMLKDFLIWVQRDVGPWGPLMLALAYIPCTIFAVPASILTLGGGYLFGLVIGFITDSIGSTLGATAAFLVGRTVGRSYVTSKLKDYPQFQAIAIAIERSGFKIVLLLRMVPLLPFNVLNYLLSVTPMSVWMYTVASWIGMMPLTLVFVYVGTTIKDITDIDHTGHFTPARWLMICVGLGTSVVIVILVTRIAKDALQRAVDEADLKVEEIVIASDPLIGPDPSMGLQQPLVNFVAGALPCKFETGPSRGYKWNMSFGKPRLHFA
ncbi:hypothetical protein R1flu_015346 [Riccia fluitans]|uniref:VTT domain-containing protein n=1 Tax=Riccia fluitans TaxID=41844 RepID=A0ABD1YJ32_9MARC